MALVPSDSWFFFPSTRGGGAKPSKLCPGTWGYAGLRKNPGSSARFSHALTLRVWGPGAELRGSPDPQENQGPPSPPQTQVGASFWATSHPAPPSIPPFWRKCPLCAGGFFKDREWGNLPWLLYLQSTRADSPDPPARLGAPSSATFHPGPASIPPRWRVFPLCAGEFYKGRRGGESQGAWSSELQSPEAGPSPLEADLGASASAEGPPADPPEPRGPPADPLGAT